MQAAKSYQNLKSGHQPKKQKALITSSDAVEAKKQEDDKSKTNQNETVDVDLPYALKTPKK